MAKKLLFLPIIVLFLLIISFETQADVLVDDADSTNVLGQGFTLETVPTGSGQEGDYVIFACGVTTDNGNSFDAPFPGTWTEFDDGICDSPDGNCFQGIWGSFVDNPASADITCEWNIPTSVFVGGSFRYNQVDPDDPIIDSACDSGADFGPNIMATAPSIVTEAGSQVVRIYTYRNFDSAGSGNTNANNDTSGSFSADSTQDTFSNVHMRGTTDLVPVDGPTGTASVDAGFDAEWRACTIALRMVPDPRMVPTMSEWGMLAFATFAGIAGFWFIRRRQLAA
ncbi:MAG: hypothetical protein DHS20C13_07300 [Thermodesulfobacteriota bacterium]|nr:MAG: hypothetical protein DHS20C13_07300 [Thermodesulfobacteriota bacterium]